MNDSTNILIVLTDQQRYDTIQKDHQCQTPHIQSLMETGVNFKKAYTTNAICSPSRASMMTGVYPSKHGMIDCTHNVKPYQASLQEGFPMWSQLLEEKGYSGGYFGKWHIERTNQLDNFGFEKYIHEWSEEYRCYREDMGLNESNFLTQTVLKNKGYKDRLFSGVIDEPVEASEPYFLYSKAMQFIKEKSNSNQPWFTVISTLEPHDPFIASQAYVDRYNGQNIELPPSFYDDMDNKPAILKRLKKEVWSQLSEKEVKQAMACYYASCSLIDDQVGRVIDLLKETGQLENTLIIYTSDHGELLGAHGLFFKGVPAYEDVYHIPLVISGTGLIENKGRESNAFVSLVDIMPTILDVANVSTNEDIDGRSLLPLLKTEENIDNDPYWCQNFAEFHGQRFAYSQRIVWQNNYKYIFNGFDTDELYDLELDPYEMKNLVYDNDSTEIIENLSKLMWRYVYQLGDYSFGNSDYGMLRFAPIGPDNEENPYKLDGPESR